MRRIDPYRAIGRANLPAAKGPLLRHTRFLIVDFERVADSVTLPVFRRV